jgi:hypothetical protein
MPQKQADYLREFVSLSSGLLNGLLDREGLPPDAGCSECSDYKLGRWRCTDCTAPQFLCRRCIRVTHRTDPLHRIEWWTGKFFRPAAMWEVGGYFPVPHCSAGSACDTQRSHRRRIEEIERRKDEEEQEILASEQDMLESAMEIDPKGVAQGGVAAEEYQFEGYQFGDIGEHVDGRHEQERGPDETEDRDTADLLAAIEEEAEEVESGAAEDIPDGGPGSAPRDDGSGNYFVRIVHHNGVHYLPLVFCLCRGDKVLHVDLMHARLLPTSFVKIRTLFTVAALDDYRLSNLELKASAYQYWEKLLRLSAKGGLHEGLDLYRELRRMSREWRWLKKIKWAGFGHTDRDPTKPEPGELAIFCPTCPQPGINLPADWQNDPHRFVSSSYSVIQVLIVITSSSLCSEVFIRQFAGDGNFKADHVRQHNPADDVWLSEGGGMMAKRADIAEFMSTHSDKHTVRLAIQHDHPH